VTKDDGSPLTELLDAMVYAPLGVASLVREHFPTLVERGRSAVHTSGAGYRAVGEFTADQLASRARSYVVEVRDLLLAMGVLTEPTEPATEDEGAPDVAAGPADAGSGEPAEYSAGAEIEAAIVGYDAMTASEIVPLLGDLSPEQRSVVKRHEQAGRARRTILGRLERLEELHRDGQT